MRVREMLRRACDFVLPPTKASEVRVRKAADDVTLSEQRSAEMETLIEENLAQRRAKAAKAALDGNGG